MRSVFIYNSFVLLPDRTLVECQLLTLEDISINTTALTRTGCDDGVQTTGLKLTLQGILNLAVGGVTGSLLLLHGLALLLLGGIGGLLLASAADGLTVVGFVPLSERSSVDLDDGRLGERVGTDEFVVRRVVGDDNNADLAGDTLRSPREVAGVETQTTVLGVTTTSADKVDSLVANTSVGGLATLLESPASGKSVSYQLSHIHPDIASIPLLAVVSSLRTGGRALVAGITRNTHVGV